VEGWTALSQDGELSTQARACGRLLVGAAFLAMAWTPAAAESVQSAAQTAPGAGLSQNGFYLEADTVIQDNVHHTATAQGHVEVRYRDRTLRAQALVYETETGVVTASGDVTIIEPDGSAEFAQRVVLDDDLSAGVALGFSARLKGNVKLAASSVVRRSADLAELNQAIYTPCDICAKDGGAKRPTWSIRADKVIQDKTRHVIYYRHAVISVLGVPLFYTPLFWHADAQSKTRSGLLAPQIQISRKRGLSYEQPYLVALSGSQDLVVSPVLSTKVNPFLNLDWRKKFDNGQIDARFGYTYEREFGNEGQPLKKPDGTPSDLTSRSYVLASGAFDIDEAWRWGFAAERSTDDLLFDRYDISGVYDRRGLWETDSRRLVSQIYAVREDQRSYVSISAVDFQGLRIGDSNDALPVVGPLIEARYEPDGPILGGRLRMTGSAVVLNRDRDPSNPALPGIDSRRATAEADWRRTLTLPIGVRLEPFGWSRFDVYNVNDLPGPGPSTDTTARGIWAAGVDASWPFYRRMGDTTVILEPLAEAVISRRAYPDPAIPNVDSADFVFDETNLFDSNRTPGFDVYDSGARLNLGGRATVDWGDGRELRGLIGRSFRQKPNLTIPNTSGYASRTSDWIVAVSGTPTKGVTVYGRMQLDPDSFALRRGETGVNVVTKFLRGYARYLHDYTDPTGERENVELAAETFVTRNWGFEVSGVRDLQRGVWARRDIGIVYQDECTRIDLLYHHEAAFVRLGGPSNSIQVRLTLATLGEQGYRGSSRD